MTEYFIIDAFSVQFQDSAGCVLIKVKRKWTLETGQMEIPKPAHVTRAAPQHLLLTS